MSASVAAASPPGQAGEVAGVDSRLSAVVPAGPWARMWARSRSGACTLRLREHLGRRRGGVRHRCQGRRRVRFCTLVFLRPVPVQGAAWTGEKCPKKGRICLSWLDPASRSLPIAWPGFILRWLRFQAGSAFTWPPCPRAAPGLGPTAAVGKVFLSRES